MQRLISILLIGTSLTMVYPALGDAAANTATNAPTEKPSRKELMVDPEDGKFDASAWLATAQGFLPIPIIITEPAIGYGGGVMVMFLHDSIQNRAERMKERNPDGTNMRLPPPSISGIFGMGTQNGTWGAGGFHMGVWKNDTIRYLGALGYISVNYDYYTARDRAIPINVEGAFLLQQMITRLGNSDFFAGANYKLLSSTARPDVDFTLPPLIENGAEVQSGGASGILEYDSRDNIFTPDRGLNAKGEWTHYDSWLGSDNQFDLLTINNRGWHPLTKTLILGARLDGVFSDGDVPFYMLPFIRMRGIPAMRYQGDHVLTAETELRWDCTPRWSLIGFAGAGWTAKGSVSDFSNSNTYPAGGFGFRYLVARVFNMRAGIDIGFSEEDTAIYITTGSAWR
jgi:hypothetical protein